MQREIFYSGKPQPACNVSYSFAVNLFTSSILVDYACHDFETLTNWPKSVAAQLSEKEKQALESIRPILAHGWVLSDYVLRHLSFDHPAHNNWSGLIQWLQTLAGQDLYQLVTEGILSGLDFYRTYMEPMPSVEECLHRLDTAIPDEETLADRKNQMIGLRALLLSWGVEDVDATAKMIADPSQFRERIVIYVQALWEKGMKADWEFDEKKLKNSVATSKQLTKPKMSARDLVIRVTGL